MNNCNILFVSVGVNDTKKHNIHKHHTSYYRERRYNKTKSNTKSKTFETITRFRMLCDRKNHRLMKINNGESIYLTFDTDNSSSVFSNISSFTSDSCISSNSYILDIWQSENF